MSPFVVPFSWHTFVLLVGSVVAQNTQPTGVSCASSQSGMVFLHHADGRFIEGLRRHGMLSHWGLRVHNTGLDLRPFGQRWLDSPLLARAGQSGRPFYIDRITGGMPFQSLAGIEAVADKLADNPCFLGFQVHEWGNSPIHDYNRIRSLLVDKGLPLDREHFAAYEGRIEPPYFSCGDYSVLHDLYRELKTTEDVGRYLESYIRRMVALTRGQVMAVNGYVQLYHLGLRAGCRNVMAEIGNQVPLTAVQIACARGAARQHGKPFGVYYEPWGGSPFGCPCALGWSPWFPNLQDPDNQLAGHRIASNLGSSRSLHRRLLYYAWLSGAAYLSEEWGVENYFANWDDYPLTEYGRVVKEFLDITASPGRPEPIVPAALVMPPGAFGIDVRCLANDETKVCGIAEPDTFHRRLRQFADDVLAARPQRNGTDDYNLTPSLWIGTFDVLSVDAPAELLNAYGLVVYFDEAQARTSAVPADRVLNHRGRKEDSAWYIAKVKPLLPIAVEGEVGITRARLAGRHMVGVFNNLGITKTDKGETADPAATREATLTGPLADARCLVGESFITHRTADRIDLRLPAGEVALLSFADQQ